MKEVLMRMEFRKPKYGEDFDLTGKILFVKGENLEEKILEELYKEYQNTEYDDLFVLDIAEFTEFVKKYLPIYRKRNMRKLRRTQRK